MTTDFKIGDMVWAKMKGYPHWPAEIVEPTSPAKASKVKSSYYVYFFGSKNYAWIQDKNIIPHTESVFDTLIKKRSGPYQQAIDEFINHLKTKSGKKENPEGKKKLASKKKDTDNESVENGSKSSKFDADDDSTEPKVSPSKSKSGKKKIYKKKPSTSISSEEKASISKPIIDDDDEESDSSSNSIDPFMHSTKMKEKRKVLHKKKPMRNSSNRKQSSSFRLKFDDDDDDDSGSSKFSNEPLMRSPKLKKTVLSGKRANKVVKVANSVSRKYKRRVYGSETPLKKVYKKKVYKKKPVDIDFSGKTGTSFSSHLDEPNTLDDSSNSSWGFSNMDSSFKDTSRIVIVENTGDVPDGTEQPKSIGFLGLDCLGKFIVKKFLKSKFDITLWKDEVLGKDESKGGEEDLSKDESEGKEEDLNKDESEGKEGVGKDESKGKEEVLHTEKGKEEVLSKGEYKGAKMANSPAEMVSNCDIIFAYYSDIMQLKKVVFSKTVGIEKGFEEVEKLGKGPKGFVLLHSIDKQTSLSIYDAITINKGQYVEAPICGTIEEAERGNLMILASGNMKLFNDCKKYFAIFTKLCKYLSKEKDDPGSAGCSSSSGSANNSSEYSTILNMLNAGVAASVAELASLCKKLGIPQQDMMNVMDAALKCNFGMKEKLECIKNHTFNNAFTPLKHAQKDLDFVLQVADSVSHPMPITSITNELFIQGKLRDYSDSDVSSIYKVLRY